MIKTQRSFSSDTLRTQSVKWLKETLRDPCTNAQHTEGSATYTSINLQINLMTFDPSIQKHFCRLQLERATTDCVLICW